MSGATALFKRLANGSSRSMSFLPAWLSIALLVSEFIGVHMVTKAFSRSGFMLFCKGLAARFPRRLNVANAIARDSAQGCHKPKRTALHHIRFLQGIATIYHSTQALVAGRP